MLVDKLKQRQPKVVVEEKSTKAPSSSSAGYWADYVKKNAELEIQVDGLKSKLSDLNIKLAETMQDNNELKIKADNLTKDKESLEQEIAFKTRVMDIMSRNLVNEREGRIAALKELNVLKAENIDLKRKSLMIERETVNLQHNISGLTKKKEDLEKRISNIESILKEKNMDFRELHNNLNTAVKGKLAPKDKSASVELPPIVVTPKASSAKSINGNIIAVNKEEKFVVVNVGESSGVRPQFIFDVMRGNKKIGSVEVIETRKDIAAADIKNIVSGYNIKEGDAVVSR